MCSLNHSSFYQVKLKKMVFKGCTLHEADFTESDLTAAVFDHCDLARATFDHTILEKARFSTAGVAGLLDKYDIDIE